MRELIDCHIHTELCGHAAGTAEEMVAAAVAAGLTGIVMTEHLPLPQDLDSENQLSMPAACFASYTEQVRDLAARADGLTVVLGVEADWLPGREQHVAHARSRAAELGVDVVMGSVHYLGDWAFDDPTDLSGWDGRAIRDVWDAYFETWCDAARSATFDVMAHPDLVKKFGHVPTGDLRDYYVEAARAAADGGVFIEASTAGWRKPVGEMYPSLDFLRAFHEAGVAATVGSDAHSPAEVGYHIEAAYRELVSVGYDHVVLPLGAGRTRRIEL